MKNSPANIIISVFLLILSIPHFSKAQVNQDQLGAWYMYFYDAKFNASKWGVQGDLQYRNWDLIGDLEQLLIRSGLTYRPKDGNIKLTLGYANITTGAFGDANTTVNESRIYQEAFYKAKLGQRFYLNHRFRYEQRFVEGQDFRTRYRYNLFVNVPINSLKIEERTLYIALYNEIFINGQKNIGNQRSVEFFDRNRFYMAVGYALNPDRKFQLGMMNQTLANGDKNQIQLSFHHNF